MTNDHRNEVRVKGHLKDVTEFINNAAFKAQPCPSCGCEEPRSMISDDGTDPGLSMLVRQTNTTLPFYVCACTNCGLSFAYMKDFVDHRIASELGKQK